MPSSGANAVTVALTFADAHYRLEAEPLIAALTAFAGVDVATSLWRWVQERRAASTSERLCPSTR
jgi:hypothetical protein